MCGCSGGKRPQCRLPGACVIIAAFFFCCCYFADGCGACVATPIFLVLVLQMLEILWIEACVSSRGGETAALSTTLCAAGLVVMEEGSGGGL